MMMNRLERLVNQIELLKHLRDCYSVSLPYEQILRENYLRFLTPSSIVIDIGAHAGEHCESFLSLLWPDGYVMAFEPLGDLARQLRDRFAAKQRILEVHEVALSDFVGESEFTHAVGTPGESGLKERRFNRPDLARPKKICVKVGRLDDYTQELPRLDYIKIDIEGAEIDCLRGGHATIAKHRPIISAEYGRASYSPYGYEVQDLWELARSMDYSCFDIFGNELAELDEWRRACDQIYWDYYLVPHDRLALFKSKVPGTISSDK